MIFVLRRKLGSSFTGLDPADVSVVMAMPETSYGMSAMDGGYRCCVTVGDEHIIQGGNSTQSWALKALRDKVQRLAATMGEQEVM